MREWKKSIIPLGERKSVILVLATQDGATFGSCVAGVSAEVINEVEDLAIRMIEIMNKSADEGAAK